MSGNSQNTLNGGAVGTVTIEEIDSTRMMQFEADTVELINLSPLFKTIADESATEFEYMFLGEGAVKQNVGEWEDTLIKSAPYRNVRFAIKKDTGHIGISDEARKKLNVKGINGLDEQLTQLNQAFAKAVCEKMIGAIRMNPQTYTGTEDWAAAGNPLKDLTRASALLDYGNKTDKYVILAPEDYATLASNEKFMFYTQGMNFVDKPGGVASRYTLVEDVTNTIPTGTAYLVAAQGAGIWVNGETKQEQYRKVGQGDAILITSWNGVSGAVKFAKGSTTLNAGVVAITILPAGTQGASVQSAGVQKMGISPLGSGNGSGSGNANTAAPTTPAANIEEVAAVLGLGL